MAITKARVKSDADAGAVLTVYANLAAFPTTGPSVGDQAFNQDNNKIYVWNGNGWFSVATVNQTPTWVTEPEGSYILLSNGVATSITVEATDPDGFPITYAYSASGLGNIATISQSNATFTVTPSTNAAHAGNFNVTFTATDGVNQLSKTSTFSLEFLVDNSKTTAVILKAEGTGDNSTFDDVSTSNHTITYAGTPLQTTFSPYRHAGYSHYFDGSGDYLRDDTIGDGLSPNSGQTEDFTIEMWVYNDDTPSDSVYIIGCNQLSQGGNEFLVGTNKTYWASSQVGIDYGSAFGKQYEWQHYVVMHEYGSGNNDIVTLWIDGTRVFRATGLDSTISLANNSFAFGTEADAGSFGSLGNYFEGYLYDVKITRSALYTSTNKHVPVPTSPSIAHPSLNVFHGMQTESIDSRFTLGGGVDTQPFTPINNDLYNASQHGGSIFFDGSGDYLQLQDNADFDLPGEFAYEFWMRRTSATSGTYQAVLGANGSGTNGLTFYVNQSTLALNVYQSSFVISGSSGDIKGHQWYHILLMRDSANLLQLFINGTRVSSSTNSASFTDNSGGAGVRIGYDISANGYFAGYITDVRIVKGSTAGYSSGATITVPTSPLTAVTNTKFLLSGTNAKIIDKNQSNWSYDTANVKVTGALASSAQQHFSENTMVFDGTDDVIDVVNPIVGYDDHTHEAWVYPTGGDATYKGFFSSAQLSSDAGIFVAKDKAQGPQGGSSTLIAFNPVVPDNEWSHIVLQRYDGTHSLYRNGVLQGQSTQAVNFSTSADVHVLRLGSRYNNNATYAFGGHIHDFRVSKGLARYPYISKPVTLTTTNSGMTTPNGTTPTVSSASNTIFLGCHAATIVDGSSNAATITTVGNAAVSTFTPYLNNGYDADTNMRSVLFDGSGDKLTATLGTTLSTTDWTVEYWVWHDTVGNGNEYHVELGTDAPTFYYRDSSNNNKMAMYHIGAFGGSNAWETFSPKSRTWYHLAWVHDDSENKVALFVNGVFWGDTTYTGDSTSNLLELGGSDMDGYLSNVRIVKEKLYDKNFTPTTVAISA